MCRVVSTTETSNRKNPVVTTQLPHKLVGQTHNGKQLQELMCTSDLERTSNKDDQRLLFDLGWFGSEKKSNPQCSQICSTCAISHPGWENWSKWCEPRFQYLWEYQGFFLLWGLHFQRHPAELAPCPVVPVLQRSVDSTAGDQVGEFWIAHGEKTIIKHPFGNGLHMFLPPIYGDLGAGLFLFEPHQVSSVKTSILRGQVCFWPCPGVKNCRPSALGACGTGRGNSDHPWLLRDGEAERQGN